MFPSSSADDLRGHDTVKRPGLVIFDDHEDGTSELDYYYGIGKFTQKIILLRRRRTIITNLKDFSAYVYVYLCFSVKRHILRHQSIINGLFPSHSSEKKIGSVRDTIYSCMAAWSLHLAYRQHDDDKVDLSTKEIYARYTI